MKPNLKNVTLLCVDCANYGKSVSALQKSMEQAEWASVKLLTDIPLEIDGIEVVEIPTIRSKEEYSDFMLKKVNFYFDTEFVMVVQHDGYVINGKAWDKEFLNYDYIGAPWLYIDGKNVGNGGASLRSKRLCEALALDMTIFASDPEDQAIGRLYRDYLIKKYDIKFAPEEVADKFSYELRTPKCPTFAFHGHFHPPYKPYVIVKRSAAMGDCIILEPLLRYYAQKGWNVVVDMPIEFYQIYKDHYFPVTHISQFDRGRIKEEKYINLDMAYEVKPKQNYLKSYFEFAGIKDYKLSRPQLYPLVDKNTKLFEKYAVVHIDDRETLHRNTYGINWVKVQKFLEYHGYTVIQIGKGDNQRIGLKINTPNIAFMKFVIAGCDLFIGVDSGPAQIAVGYNKPCVLLFGSVNPDYIHPDLTDVEVIQGNCDKAGCWHIVGGTRGSDCHYMGTDRQLQCCKHSEEEVIDAINKLQNK